MRKHLAIFDLETIKIIFSGKKTIESRFSQGKIAPFGQINIGDLVYIKAPGKDILGQFKVKKVISFEGLDGVDWDMIKLKYGKGLTLGNKEKDRQFFEKHLNAKYATIIYIGQVEQFITSPIRIQKKDLRGWVVLD